MSSQTTKSIMKRLPFHIKMIIFAVGIGLGLMLLLILSCMGATDGAYNEMATSSAQSFYIKLDDDTTVELTEFTQNGKTIETSGFTLVAKNSIIVKGLSFGNETLTQSVNVEVVGIGISSPDNSGEDDAVLITKEITGTETELIFDFAPELSQDMEIKVSFDSEISLEYIFVDFEKVENNA